MKRFMKISCLTFIFCFITSCNGQLNNNLEFKNQKSVDKVTLIVSVSGGTRAHIINIDNNKLSYKIGSFFVLDSLDLTNVVWNKNYKEIRKTLTDKDVEKIKNYSSKKEELRFKDPKIVKDSLEYYLYINGKKIAFGRKFNYNSFPKTLKDLINEILNLIGDLYEIPGMS